MSGVKIQYTLHYLLFKKKQLKKRTDFKPISPNLKHKEEIINTKYLITFSTKQI